MLLSFVSKLSSSHPLLPLRRFCVSALFASGVSVGLAAQLPEVFVFTDAPPDTWATFQKYPNNWPGTGVVGELSPAYQADFTGLSPASPIGMSMSIFPPGKNGQYIWIPWSAASGNQPASVQPYPASVTTSSATLANQILNGASNGSSPSGYALQYPLENQLPPYAVIAQDIEYISDTDANYNTLTYPPNVYSTAGYAQATLLLWAQRQNPSPPWSRSFNTLMPVMGGSMAKSLSFDASELQATLTTLIGAPLLQSLGLKFQQSGNNYYTSFPAFLYDNNLCDVIAIQSYDNTGLPYSKPSGSKDSSVSFPASTVPFILVSTYASQNQQPSSSQYNLGVGRSGFCNQPTSCNPSLLYMPWLTGFYIGGDGTNIPPASVMTNVSPVPYTSTSPSLTTRKLKVSVSGATGSVQDRQNNVHCTTGCTSTHPLGAKIKLVAKPQQGHRFLRWTAGPCRGKRPTCTIELKKSTAVRAVFK